MSKSGQNQFIDDKSKSHDYTEMIKLYNNIIIWALLLECKAICSSINIGTYCHKRNTLGVNQFIVLYRIIRINKLIQNNIIITDLYNNTDTSKGTHSQKISWLYNV